MASLVQNITLLATKLGWRSKEEIFAKKEDLKCCKSVDSLARIIPSVSLAIAQIVDFPQSVVVWCR